MREKVVNNYDNRSKKTHSLAMCFFIIFKPAEIEKEGAKFCDGLEPSKRR